MFLKDENNDAIRKESNETPKLESGESQESSKNIRDLIGSDGFETLLDAFRTLLMWQLEKEKCNKE